VALVAQQIFEQLELAGRQVEQPFAPRGAPRHEIELEIGGFQPVHFRWAAAAQQRASPGEEFGQRKWFDEVVVCSEIQPKHAIVDGVTGGQNQDGGLDMALPEGLQDFEAAAARQHQVEDDEVEEFGVGSEKSVLTGRRHEDVVMLRLQGGGEDLREFSFVFNDEDAHQSGMLPNQGRGDPDFCVRAENAPCLFETTGVRTTAWW
jgi:hypothetical protein